MFPFYRKHAISQNSNHCPGRRQLNSRDSEEYEMSDEEYSRYINENDNSRHQLTRGAHDRYCNKILRDKEDVLLSSLSQKHDFGTPTNSIRLGPNSHNLFKCLLNNSVDKCRESISLPSSPTENKNFLNIDVTNRRKSDTMAQQCANNTDNIDEYILTLKIDDLAANIDDVSCYRIGPKLDSPEDLQINNDYISNSMQIFDSNFATMQCRKIDEDISHKLKKLILGPENSHVPKQWMRQCFSFCHIPVSRWRLVQMKPGCCGVIAAVEAYLIKALIFNPGYCKFRDPLRPNQKEVVDAFIQALANILWQAGDCRRGVVLVPDGSVEFNEAGSYSQNFIKDLFMYVEYYNYEELKESVATNMKYFTNAPNHGYLNFVISVVLSRGINRVLADMDDDVSLITENGHCSLELVMLMISGKATSNVFDNDIQIDSCLLKGVKKEVDIGLLSLYEHLNTCEVGSYLKSPRYPIWLVNYADHFTVLFSSKLEYVGDTIQQPFVLYHYDSMTAFSCDNDIKLVIDPSTLYPDDQFESDQTNLQLCVRTKWKNAIVIYAENSELHLV